MKPSSRFDRRRLGVILLVVIAMGLCPQGAAYAAERCYLPEEAAAESLLRLHSELMVVAVTCKQGSTGRDLGAAYAGFTRRHSPAIQAAEKTLIERFSSIHGAKSGLAQLDRFRTRLANEYGQVAADESAPAFCARRRDKLTAVFDSRLSDAGLEKEFGPYAALSSVPLCENVKKTKGMAAR